MRLIQFLFLFVGVVNICAQDQLGTIKGQLTDGKGEKLSLVQLELLDEDNINLVGEAETNTEGVFSIKSIPYGTYSLHVNAIGYASYEKKVVLSEKEFNLKTIVLSQEQIQLKGVTIRGETSQYRNEIDKKVIDVGKDLVNAGSDAAAVLNNIPSVSVDDQSGELTLRGNDNVKVMVDGKPSNVPTAQLLKQLSSDMISKIEIITNPSAKYDPEGNSGIINIITNKQKRRGYNGGINMGMTHGRTTGENASANLNLNTGAFNFFGNYSANFRKNKQLGNVKNLDTNINQEENMLYDNVYQMGKLGFDWFITEKTALTIYSNQMFSYSKFFMNETITDVNNIKNFMNKASDRGDYWNQDYNLNFKRDFNKETHSIELDAIVSRSKYDENKDSDDAYPTMDLYNEKRNNKDNNIRINLDYTNQIIDAGKIEVGIQFREEEAKRALISDRVFTTPEGIINGRDENSDFTRDIYSAYLNYGQKIGKFAFQLGTRLENVEEKSNYSLSADKKGEFSKNYTQFYPSVFLTYDIWEKGQFALNYSKRVDRPQPRQLTPIQQWSSVLLSNEGNPELRPQYTDSFEFSFLQQIKKGNINATVFYRNIKDKIIFDISKDENSSTDRMIQRNINYDKTDSYGIELSGNYKPFKWWSFNASADWFRNTIVDEKKEIKVNSQKFRINNTFNLSKNLSLQHFAMYRGKFTLLIGEQKEMWKMDLGLRYTLMDGKASFTARVNDIFNTFRARVDIDSPYNAIFKNRWESNTFYLGFSYNFGGEVKSRKEIHQKEGDSNQGGGGGVGL